VDEHDAARPVRGLRLVLIVVGQTILVVGGLLFVYWLLPIQQRFDGQWVLRLAGGLLVTGIVLAWQIRSIWHSHFPVVRAVRALVTGLSVFVLVFAITYVSVSRQQSGSFSEPLGKVSALYFAVTVVATVGFGDIVPRTDLARAITTAQMLLDLIFVATAGRLLVTSATRRASTRDKPDTET
jgi:hypothetical protein